MVVIFISNYWSTHVKQILNYFLHNSTWYTTFSHRFEQRLEKVKEIKDEI